MANRHTGIVSSATTSAPAKAGRSRHQKKQCGSTGLSYSSGRKAVTKPWEWKAFQRRPGSHTQRFEGILADNIRVFQKRFQFRYRWMLQHARHHRHTNYISIAQCAANHTDWLNPCNTRLHERLPFIQSRMRSRASIASLGSTSEYAPRSRLIDVSVHAIRRSVISATSWSRRS